MVPSRGFLRIKNGGDSKSIQQLARSCELKVSPQRSLAGKKGCCCGCAEHGAMEIWGCPAVKSVILLEKLAFANRQCFVLVWQRYFCGDLGDLSKKTRGMRSREPR